MNMNETITGLHTPQLRHAVEQLREKESHVPTQARMALWRGRNQALLRYRHREHGRHYHGAMAFAPRNALALTLALMVLASVSFWSTRPSYSVPDDQPLAANVCESCQSAKACFL